jgi:hypothetical protein
MSATDVVEHGAGKPIAGHLATACPQRDKNVECRLEPPAAQVPELALSCARQLDLDRPPVSISASS